MTEVRGFDRSRLLASGAAATLLGMEPVRPSDPVIEAYKAGIDRTLLVENLRRSVDDRFRNLMALQRFAEELRAAGKDAADKRRAE